MKFATYKNGYRDGRVVMVSTDLRQALMLDDWTTLQSIVEEWTHAEPILAAIYRRLNAGAEGHAFDFDPTRCEAPLPRAAQWCDASAFLNHSHLMQTAFNMAPIPNIDTTPLMYQGASDDFLGPHDDVALPSESHGIDFEGEYGVVLDEVPMGASPARAARHVRLLLQINDVSLRALGPREMRSGFGFLQAKPSTSFAPVAVTPDELGASWADGRVRLPLEIDWNGERFGQPNGGEMHFSFYELAAHAATTRRLRAGTIIGSGTISNAGGAAGSACIAERRAIETIRDGAASTPFMRFGDRVRMEARTESGGPLFGAIDQRIVQAAIVD